MSDLKNNTNPKVINVVKFAVITQKLGAVLTL